MFSKACEYGIRAVLFIATKSMNGERVRLKHIAEEVGAPEAFTAKVLQILARNDIIQSVTGPKGGFFIEYEDLDTIKLIEIVRAIDGDALLVGCGLGLPYCDAKHPCPVHHQFKHIRDDLINMLESLSIKKLARGVDNRLTFLKY